MQEQKRAEPQRVGDLGYERRGKHHTVSGEARGEGESIRAEREGTLRAEARGIANFRGGKRGVHGSCGGNGS